MKKLVLMLVVAVMLCGTVNAQSMFKSRVEGVTGTEFYFGPKFGFNLSNVHNSEMDNKFSFHVGLRSLNSMTFSVYNPSYCTPGKELAIRLGE